MSPRGPRVLRAGLRLARRLVLGLVLALYLLVSRTIAFVGALYVALYFLAGTSVVKDLVRDAISSELPGFVSVAAIEWGPAPWDLRVADGRILGEHGEPIVRVEAAHGRLELWPTLLGALRMATRPSQPLTLRFREVTFGRSTAAIRVDAQDRVGIERAFYREEDPPDPEPFTFDIRAARVNLLDVGGTVDVPGYHLDAAGLRAVSDFSLTGRNHLRFAIAHAQADRAVHTLTSEARAGARLAPVVLAVSDVEVEGFRWDGWKFDWRSATGTLPDGQLRVSGGFDVDPTPVHWHGEAEIHLAAGATSLAALDDGAFRGPLALRLRGRGTTEQAEAHITAHAERFTLWGLPLEDLRLALRTLPRATPGDPEAHALAIDALSFDGLGGRVAVHDGIFGPRAVFDSAPLTAHASAEAELSPASRPDELAATLRLDGVRTDALLAAAAHLRGPAPGAADALASAAALPGPDGAPHPLGATLYGNLHLGGLHDGPAGALDLEAHLDDLVVAWDGAAGLPLPGDYRVGGMLRWRSAPTQPSPLLATAGPLRLLSLERIAVDGRGDRLRLEGEIDLASGALDLTPYLRIGDLHDTARSLALPDLRGRLVLKDARITGTLDAPRVRAVASWSAAALGAHALGHVTATLRLDDGVLDVREARARTDLGAFALDGRLTLFDGAFDRPSPTRPFRVDRLDAQNLDLGALAPALGLRAPVDLEQVRLAGELSRPLETLTGQGRFAASDLSLGGESLRRVSARFDANAQQLALHDVVVVGPGGERATADLTLTRAGRRLHGTVRAKDVPLQAVRALARAAPELRGSVSTHLTLGGTLDQPTVIGRVALGSVSIGAVELGDADLDLQTLPAGRIDISSADFFSGLALEDESYATLDGFALTHLHLGVRADGARLSDLLPAARRAGLQVTARATATLDVAPGTASKTWGAHLDAPPGGIELSLRDQGSLWSNASALAVRLDPTGVALAPVAFATATRGGPDTSAQLGAETLELCGTLTPAGALDLQLGGVADLGLLSALKDAFSALEGQLVVGPAPAVAAGLGDARCLPAERGDAVLRVAGPLGAPTVTGHLVPRGVSIIPRDFGRELRLVDGRGVELLAGPAAGEQRIVSSPERGLVLEVDDGTLAVGGALALSALAPDHAELTLVGTDLFYARPGEFSATFNPTLTLRALDLAKASPRLALAGQVLITEGHFTKSFDTLAQALGSALGDGAHAGYSRPLAEVAPWLAELTLAIDLSSSDFEIDSAFPLGVADMSARLDLTVSGTLGAPRIHRRIDLLPGGSLTYRVFRRDFTLRSGFADFDGDAEHPTLDVVAQTAVTYIARASSDTQDEDEKEVVIALRIHGRVPDLQIEMTSDDSTFDQDDLQSLILTGRPRRELDRSTGSSVVTADLAAVFNDVLKAPFVRTAAVGLSREGDLRADVGTCFGPDLCITTTAVQETTETTLRARFRLHLGDDLTCDGTLRRSDTAATTSTEETYEARCRYRIPLD